MPIGYAVSCIIICAMALPLASGVTVWILSSRAYYRVLGMHPRRVVLLYLLTYYASVGVLMGLGTMGQLRDAHGLLALLWVLWIGGASGALVLAAVCAGCIWNQRSLGRYKCSRCGYDRSGISLGARCPECGAEASSKVSVQSRAHPP